MNENTFFVQYQWSGFVDGGFVSPSWSLTPGGKPHVEACALYGPQYNFCGTWQRYNMPQDFIRWIEEVIRKRIPVIPRTP